AALADVDPPEPGEPDWAAGVLDRLTATATGAEQEADDARAAFSAADALAAAAVTTADLQRRRVAARTDLERLEADRPAIESARARIVEAVRVLPVLPAVDAADRAVAATAAATVAL